MNGTALLLTFVLLGEARQQLFGRRRAEAGTAG